MPSLHLRGLTAAHLSHTPVLQDVDLDVHAEGDTSWVGVVGANGAGKSTLLRLVAGELAPTAGDLTVTSDRPPVLVPQSAPEVTDAVRTFGWDWDGHAQRLRRLLELDPDDLDPTVGRGWQALSPGTRRRWLLAAALASEPDVLLLDEPTNHLDGGGRTLLLDALRTHRGLGLVVSHDRDLLDALTTRTLRVADGTLTLHPGSHATASARWEAAARSAADADAAARRTAASERRRLGDLRRARHGAEASAQRERRLAGPRDSDAREMGRKANAAAAEAAIARRVAAQHSRLERAEAAVATGTRDFRGEVTFAASDDRRPRGGTVAHVVGDVPHAGGATHLVDVDVRLAIGDRVHVAGANGAGKSTLVRAVLGALPDGTGVAALPQVVPATVVDALDGLDPAERGRVLGTAARLGVVPARVLDTKRASPGERRKLAIARLLVEPTDVLVLDEPTNHLDLPAIEALQDALSDWRGTLLLVTHDERLARAATATTWTVRDGRVLT